MNIRTVNRRLKHVAGNFHRKSTKNYKFSTTIYKKTTKIRLEGPMFWRIVVIDVFSDNFVRGKF